MTVTDELIEAVARAIDSASYGQLHISEPVAMAKAAIRALEAALSVPAQGAVKVAPRGGVERNWWEEYQLLLRQFKKLVKAARQCVEEVDANLAKDDWPVKYRAPFGSLTKLREALPATYEEFKDADLHSPAHSGDRNSCDFPKCGCSSGAMERCEHPPMPPAHSGEREALERALAEFKSRYDTLVSRIVGPSGASAIETLDRFLKMFDAPYLANVVMTEEELEAALEAKP